MKNESLTIKIDHFIDNKVNSLIIGKKILKFLRSIGFSQAIRKIIVKRILDKEMKNPSVAMKRSAIFFNNNRNRINKIYEILADKESKDTYIKAIEYRVTHDRKNAPKIYSAKEQYFCKEIIKFSEEEVFVDCGAYTGDTINCFLKVCNNKYKKIVCFEPDRINYDTLTKKSVKNIHFLNVGVWDKNTILGFETDNGKSSRISEDSCSSTDTVEVMAIDFVKECQDATFIKMDIEGAELKALIGAEQTILRNKPKLAICIYHKDEDYLDIAEYLHNLVPEYNLYVRHYMYEPLETVLYAVI